MNKASTFLHFFVGLLLLTLLLAAAPLRAQTDDGNAANTREADFIVAIVNTEVITNHEVRTRMARIQHDLSQQQRQDMSEAQLRERVLEMLISERAELQYAREIGLQVSDAALEQAELSIARQNQLESIEQLRAQLQQEDIDLQAFEADLRNQVLIARLRQTEIEPRVKVSESEVEAFVREQHGNIEPRQEVNLAMILIAVPERASASQKRELEQKSRKILNEIQAGAGFAEQARTHSQALDGGENGGELGLRPTDRYPELFVEATRQTPVGGVVGPISSEAGFHLLKVLERKSNRDLPEVAIPQTRVRHILLTTDAQQTEQSAIERLADFKRRIESGQATFAQLAREHSQDPSAEDGGELGWISPGQATPEFEQAMNNLDVGQISDPVVSRFGVHLLQVQERDQRILDADEQRALARSILREKKADEEFEAWSREVRGQAYVEYRDPPK